jgi:hypothetical protein
MKKWNYKILFFFYDLQFEFTDFMMHVNINYILNMRMA